MAQKPSWMRVVIMIAIDWRFNMALAILALALFLRK